MPLYSICPCTCCQLVCASLKMILRLLIWCCWNVLFKYFGRSQQNPGWKKVTTSQMHTNFGCLGGHQLAKLAGDGTRGSRGYRGLAAWYHHTQISKEKFWSLDFGLLLTGIFQAQNLSVEKVNEAFMELWTICTNPSHHFMCPLCD